MPIDYVDDNCIGCQHCYTICPVDVIRWNDSEDRPVIQYLEDCVGCCLCEKECPEEAIHTTPLRVDPLMVPWG